ncbi:MAG: hypothetical protein C0507_16250 [Cyanobacteria bacterium PR.3.49]|nr:hypothetical protein [Cyanobacteria bacterium PR.3.49]
MEEGQKQQSSQADAQSELVEGSENTLGLSWGAAAELKPGQIVADKYEVLEEVGRGGMGVVYRVEQLALGRVLAMKTLNAQEVSDVVWRRFQLEAKAAALLDHPNLISVHDCGLIDNTVPYFIMDFIEGTNLAKLIKDKGALSLEETLTIFIQVCFGLSYAHAVGVVHRDLKPSNIMLVPPQSDSNGLSVRVVDFGIAKLTAEEYQPTQALTRTGEIFGSPLYMSPEQCLGKPVDERSDIYSLGCVLFEALTGLPPFIGQTALSTMMQHQSTEAPTLKQATLGKEFPDAIEKIVRLMLEKNPESRYQDMKSVARDLSFLQQGISHHPQVSTESKAEAIARINRLHIAQMACACLLSAAVAASAVYSSMKNEAGAAYKAGFNEGANPARNIYIPNEGGDNADGGPISTVGADRNGKACRTFNFGSAKGFGLGYVRLLDRNFKPIPAKGILNFALEEPLCLDIEDKVIVTSPKFLLRFNSNDFVGMRFRFNFGVNDSTFRYLDRLKDLRILDVTGCEVSSQLVEQLNKLPKLEYLKVGKTNMSGQGLLKLQRLSQLKVLGMSRITAQADVLKHLKGSSNIEELRLSGEDLTPQDLKLIGTMKNLRNLWIEKGRNVDDSNLSWISGLQKLEVFSAEDSMITPKFMNIVPQLPRLRLVCLNHKVWSEADLARFHKKYPRIEIAKDIRVTD